MKLIIDSAGTIAYDVTDELITAEREELEDKLIDTICEWQGPVSEVECLDCHGDEDLIATLRTRSSWESDRRDTVQWSAK